MVNDAKSDVKTTLTAAKNTAGQLTNIIDGIIDAGDGFIENVSTQVNDAFTTLSNDANSAAIKLSKIEVVNQKKIKANNKLITIFNAVQDNLGINCSRVLTRLKNANDKQNAIIKKIETICTEIKTKGALRYYSDFAGGGIRRNLPNRSFTGSVQNARTVFTVQIRYNCFT
jgi:hypothetical protein